MPLAFSDLSAPATGATVLVIVLVRLAMRLFGRRLMRSGARMEAKRHGPLPGGYMDPGRRRRVQAEEPATVAEPERYDPFNSG